NSRCSTPTVSPGTLRGAQRVFASELSLTCRQPILPAGSPLQCGWPCCRLQHVSGANRGSEMLMSPQNVAASTALRDGLNRYSVPERASGNSFCKDCEMTVQASFSVI